MNVTDKASREAITDEAALWHARLDSGSADLEAFEAWRNADPAHAAAFARMAATAEILNELGTTVSGSNPGLLKRNKIDRRTMLGGAAGFVAVAGGACIWGASQARASATTAVGDRKSVTMPDNGRLDLNTDSRASWKFDQKTRRIWLERGEIALWVPDDPRPCLLFAAGQTVTLNSGELNARLRTSAVDVTVTKGICTVKSASAPGSQRGITEVRAGEAVLSAPKVSRVRHLSDSDLLFTSGWQQGELVLQGQSLGTAVSEYNRYLSSKIVIIDPELAGIRLGGRFSTKDPKDFLFALETSFDIHVVQLADGVVALSR